MVILPSLVQLARLVYNYDYVVGAIERASSKYLDCYCYPRDEASYEMYWSSAEALTQSSCCSEYIAADTEESD